MSTQVICGALTENGSMYLAGFSARIDLDGGAKAGKLVPADPVSTGAASLYRNHVDPLENMLNSLP